MFKQCASKHSEHHLKLRDQNRQCRGVVQPLQIDHIETGKCDALQQDGLQTIEIFAAGDAVDQPLCGISIIAVFQLVPGSYAQRFPQNGLLHPVTL